MWAAEQGITESGISAPGEAVSAEQLRAALKRMAEILNAGAVIDDEPAESGKPLTRAEAAAMIYGFARMMTP